MIVNYLNKICLCIRYIDWTYTNENVLINIMLFCFIQDILLVKDTLCN